MWMKRLWPGRLRPGTLSVQAVAVIVACGVAALVIGLRGARILEPAELSGYDAFVRARAAVRESAPDPRIVVVGVTERDIQDLGTWPLPDGVLARTLEALLKFGPRAIGIDIYRDVAIPPGSEEFDAVLRRDRRIVAVTKFAEGSSAGVRPPAALAGTDQVGFNDIVVDSGGTVRRALLFLDDGKTVMYSFALRLALLYLEKDGVSLGPDPADESLVRLGQTTIHALGPNDGPYVRLDASGYQFLADFQHRRPFQHVSLGALLRGEVSASVIADRIVLIGVTAESVKDDFYTPLHTGLGVTHQTAGVEIHGHFIRQLLRVGLNGDAPLRSPWRWPEWAWIVAASAFGAWVGTRERRPWRLATAVLTGLVGIVAVAFIAFLARWWWPVVPPAMTWIGAMALVVAYQSYREGVERGMLMKLFSQHVSTEVAEAIWRDREQFAAGGRPAPLSLTVTALFTDLTGYSTVSEGLRPEALIEWLNEYMDAMAQEISRHGGVIRQYAGDSIVVMFGVPVPRTDEAEVARDAANAVRCALAMERRLLRLNQEWSAAGRPVTGMRVGIVTGPATSGTLGSRDRWEYVVVGDTLNTAARLEQFEKDLHAPDPFIRPCRILVSASTFVHIDGLFEAEWIAERALKGKEQLVAIYRIVGERTDKVPAPLEPAVSTRA